MAGYAKNTTVTVMQSRADIQSAVARFGAVFDGIVDEPGRVIIMFHGHNRWVRFVLSLHRVMGVQAERELWRALYLSIKGKLVCVQSGIETFEQAFYAHILTEDDLTIAEKYKPALKQITRVTSDVGH